MGAWTYMPIRPLTVVEIRFFPFLRLRCGARARIAPMNLTPCQKEMRPAVFCSPDGRSERRAILIIDSQAPRGPVMGEQAEVDWFTASARTKHGDAPRARVAYVEPFLL
jgi:hypothetical protein